MKEKREKRKEKRNMCWINVETRRRRVCTNDVNNNVVPTAGNKSIPVNFVVMAPAANKAIFTIVVCAGLFT